MREIEVSFRDLHGSASGLGRSSDGLLGEVEILRAGLTGDGDPWGDDELGGEIGAFYHGLIQMALDKGTSIAHRYETDSAKLMTMSENHRNSELGNTEIIERVTHPDVLDV